MGSHQQERVGNRVTKVTGPKGVVGLWEAPKRRRVKRVGKRCNSWAYRSRDLLRQTHENGCLCLGRKEQRTEQKIGLYRVS